MPLSRRALGATLLAASAISAARAQGAEVEEVLSLPGRPGNPAVLPDGRLVFSMHPFGRPEFKLMERRADGTVAPFPNEAGSRDGFAAVIGLRAAEDGTLWVLDMGAQGMPPKLTGWDTRSRSLVKEIPIGEEATRPNSFLQDFALDQRRGVAFIADSTRGEPVGESRPAIIAVDLASGRARRLLENHPSFRAEPLDTVAEGKPLRTLDLRGQPHPFRLALDPITISPDDEWVYFGPMTGRGLYRVRAGDLANASLSADALAARIERYREKRVSDGISVDREGNVYVTDVGENGIGVATAQGYRLLVSDPRMVWPDGLAFGPDGWLYVTVNQLNRGSAQNGGQEAGQPPYHIFRVRPLAPSAVGR